MHFKTLVYILALLATISFATLTVHAQRASVETIQFQSKLINATLPYSVILPPGYRADATTRYPVLYLLHGHGGHYTDWLTRTNVADVAAQYRMIIVMPEGNDSWYVDGATGLNDKYESYILQELMPDVDKRYRTIQSRYGRAIAGLSMGGYGAIKYGVKYPATFVFAASMSGAFGATRYTEKEMGGPNWGPFLKTFGPLGSETRKANTRWIDRKTTLTAYFSNLCHLCLSVANSYLMKNWKFGLRRLLRLANGCVPRMLCTIESRAFMRGSGN